MLLALGPLQVRRGACGIRTCFGRRRAALRALPEGEHLMKKHEAVKDRGEFRRAVERAKRSYGECFGDRSGTQEVQQRRKLGSGRN